MKIFTPALMLLAMSVPALAQSTPAAPAEKVVYICYYNAAGKFTSSKPAEGKIVPGTFVTTGRGGDHAWVYGIKSTDGNDCPTRVRN